MIKRSENQARPPFPPFTRETAMQKVRMAEDGWNNRDPEKVTLAYTVNSEWRNRNAFLNSRAEIVQILKRMWATSMRIVCLIGRKAEGLMRIRG